MRKTTIKYICDCCQKEVTKDCIGKLHIPLFNLKEDGIKTLCVEELDICNECAQKFAELYYKIAEEHGSTGLRAFEVTE